ncbi:MAG: protein kinase [Verrucomicrobia bacterium]|nr:protein kinase [Verrucomicrobiota bacterium]
MIQPDAESPPAAASTGGPAAALHPGDAPTLRGPEPGQRVFGRYGLEKILGRGGMGVVWAAFDETLRERVALKFLPDAVRWDPAAFDDLKAETRRARSLTHSNIVRIHDFVEDSSAAAISMELVDGKTLTDIRLEKAHKIFEPADIAPWLPQLCAALDYAHAQAKVVHRDLKPANIMLTRDGMVKIADFGVARSLADSITRVSMMSAGTLVYMSPQQAMGEEPSPSDDIYSLGATLYELLTGKPPFHTGDVRVQLFQRKPDSLIARRKSLGVPSAGDVPPAWENTIAACLAKEADHRPATTGEIAVKLGRALRAPPVRARIVSRRPTRRELLLATLALVLGWSALTSTRFSPVPPNQRGEDQALQQDSAPRPFITEKTAPFPSDATRALAAWNLDGDARDASGHGFDGSVGRAVPTTDRFGRIDHAMRFNGDAEVVLPDAPDLRWSGAQPFAAAIWVWPEDGGQNDGAFWSYAGDAVHSLHWALAFQRGRVMATLTRMHTSRHGEAVELTSAAALSTRAWHHVALVSDGSALALYIDGARAVAGPLGVAATAVAPTRVDFRLARPERLSPWAFAGALDDARVWKRALSPEEIVRLASREPPPWFGFSHGAYRDTDDLSAALAAEFGPAARLADWDELTRLHADDTAAWADEIGFRLEMGGMWAQRASGVRFDDKRHYMVQRFSGVRPDYYGAHAELGGMVLALGSWYGNRSRLLVAAPASAPQTETLAAAPDGVIRRGRLRDASRRALALTWRARLTLPAAGGEVVAMIACLRLQDGREWRAVCRSEAPGTMALALGDGGASERTRQVNIAYGECDFTLVARDGRLHLRAVTAIGANLVFQETLSTEALVLADVTSLELSAPPTAGVTKSVLILE